MSDSDFNALLSQPLDTSLDGLETKIWAGVARHDRDQRTARLAVTLQACVLAVSIAIVGVVGADAAAVQRGSSGSALVTDNAHAPSQLLLGVPR